MMRIILIALQLVAASGRLAPAQSRVKALSTSGGGYAEFARNRPAENGIILAGVKTAAADALAQAATPGAFDLKRNAIFGLFGALYLGAFQYWYQVNIFKKVFTSTERFTSQSFAAKLEDTEGLIQLAAQIVVNLTILACIYLPTFYLFKAVFFSDCGFPLGCCESTWKTYTTNLGTDLPALLKCWGPADLVCFSVPLYLRIPIRHLVSFCWTIYLSLSRGAN